jgi:hypothetical protein
MDEGDAVGRETQAGRTITVRCAWCGRLRLGGDWRERDEFEAMALLERVTHFSDGICPDCLAGYTDRTA